MSANKSVGVLLRKDGPTGANQYSACFIDKDPKRVSVEEYVTLLRQAPIWFTGEGAEQRARTLAALLSDEHSNINKRVKINDLYMIVLEGPGGTEAWSPARRRQAA